MPMDVNSSELIPTLLLNPDTRFGTSFLDVIYRKYSVTGEALLDKSTGELYFRRKEDGKLVSFNQNYRDLYDQVWQLNVIKANNPGFTYPLDDSKSLFLSTNYDLGCINGEENVFISSDIFSIKNFAEYDSVKGEVEEIDSKTTLQFRLSSDTRGFFTKVTSRAVDKISIEYLSKVYNNVFGDIEGDKANDTIVTKENEKFRDGFDIINGEISMTIRLSGSTEKSVDYNSYIRMNAPSYIDLTIPIAKLLEDYDDDDYTITVYINSIDPYKVRTVLNNLKTVRKYDTTIDNDINTVIYGDKQIGLVNVNIMHFVDKVSDIIPLGNDTVVSTFDIPTMRRVVGEIESVKYRPAIVVSPLQPDPSIWAPGILWGERITDVDMIDGSSYDAGSVIDVDWLASRVNFTATGYTKISENDKSKHDLLYTKNEVEEES